MKYCALLLIFGTGALFANQSVVADRDARINAALDRRGSTFFPFMRWNRAYCGIQKSLFVGVSESQMRGILKARKLVREEKRKALEKASPGVLIYDLAGQDHFDSVILRYLDGDVEVISREGKWIKIRWEIDMP
jgi:hypothetical protein